MNLNQIKSGKTLLITAFFLIISHSAVSQEGKSLAEMLGYPKDSKLLIIHADDMGLAQSVNSATMRAFGKNGITSGSLMVPCPWAYEMADYLRKNPGLDVGIHLTLTAEWEFYKWDGVTSSDKIPSLLDDQGYLYPSVEAVGKAARAEEAEMEIKSQIEKAISWGIEPTHIDTHMGSVLATPELVRIYISLSKQYNLPILFPRAYISFLPPETAKILQSEPFLLDNLFMIEPEMIKRSWLEPYRKAVEEMKPGLNQIIVHLGYDNDELKAITINHDDYGSAWRQKDLDLVLSDEFNELLRKNNIILIGWKQIRDLMRKR